MASLIDISEMLDGAAQSLRQFAEMPVEEGISISEGFDKLRAVFGADVHLAIKADFDCYRNGKVQVKWEVYRGQRPNDVTVGTFTADTLAEAINDCIKASSPPKEADAEKAMATVEDALNPPPPF